MASGYLLWVLGLIALASSRALAAAKRAAVGPDRADALARMLVAETGGRGDRAELAAIAQVAVNRARHDGIDVVAVVSPPGRWSRGVWNTSDRWARDFRGAERWAGFGRARAIAIEVLSGSSESKIGGRVQFVHAANFDRCADSATCRNGWVCMPTPSGPRCVPRWSTVDPVHVGRATFSVPL